MATSLANLVFKPSGGSYRPPQWSKKVQMFYIYIPPAVNSPANTATNDPATGFVITASGVTGQKYFFDAVLSADHDQQAQITEEPVQTGANISDHAFIKPARITLDIGMSDAMQSYASSSSTDPEVAAGTWTYPNLSGAWGVGSGFQGATISPVAGTQNTQTTVQQPTSCSAYQTLISWMAKRVLMSLTTRLVTYNNVMVESVRPRETNATIAGLRCQVVFKQVFIAQTVSLPSASGNVGGGSSASGSPMSARPQDMNATGTGQVTPTAPTTSQLSQYGSNSGSDVIGAGNWSSNPSALA